MGKNIVLIGMMGCGKTTIGRLLKERLGKDHYDMDEEIVHVTKMSIPDMFAVSEDYFREEEHQLCEALSGKQDLIISTGGGVIKRPDNIPLLKENGIIFYIDRPVENILTDIIVSERPLLKDGAEILYLIYQTRHQLYVNAADYIIDNRGSLEETIEQIISCYQGT